MDPETENLVPAGGFFDDPNVRLSGTICASGKAAGSLTQQDVEAGCFALSVAENQRGELVTSGVAQALSRGGGGPGQGYPAVMVRDVGGIAAVAVRMNDNGGWKNPVSDLSNTLRGGRRGPVQAIAFHHTQDPISSSVFPCLSRKTDGMGVAEGMCVRRLAPRECERLQGFPADWTAIPGAADGPRYRAIGNSMAVCVMRWLGRRIDFVDRLLFARAA